MWIDRLIIKINAKVGWRVSRKLTVLIGVLLFTLALTGLSSIYALSAANARFRRTLEINIRRLVIAAQMNDDLMRYDRLVVEHIRSRYRADQARIGRELDAINARFDAAIDDLKKLKPDSTSNEIQGDLEPSWREYDRTVRRILAKSGAGRADEAMELWDGWASVRYRDIKYLIKQVISYNLRRAEASEREADRSFARTRFRIVAFIALVSVFAILLGIIIVRYLQIGLRDLVLANERVSRGDLSQGLDLALSGDHRDELGALAESNRKVVASIKQMVEDVAALTARYLPHDAAAPSAPTEMRDYADLIDMEKTTALIRHLTQSLAQLKQGAARMRAETAVDLGLDEAHRQTLTALDDFHRELEKLDLFLDSLAALPGKLGRRPAPGTRAGELLNRLQDLAAQVIETMEIAKFGLLDQKMRLDAGDAAGEDAAATDYLANLARVLKNTAHRAESLLSKARRLEQDLEKAAEGPPDAAADADGAEPNEYQMLLENLERIMASSSGGARRDEKTG